MDGLLGKTLDHVLDLGNCGGFSLGHVNENTISDQSFGILYGANVKFLQILETMLGSDPLTPSLPDTPDRTYLSQILKTCYKIVSNGFLL